MTAAVWRYFIVGVVIYLIYFVVNMVELVVQNEKVFREGTETQFGLIQLVRYPWVIRFYHELKIFNMKFWYKYITG